jgi:hypothetical protein
VECLEADATAVERLPLEPLEPFDAVDDADFLAGWLAPEEVEATILLDFVGVGVCAARAGRGQKLAVKNSPMTSDPALSPRAGDKHESPEPNGPAAMRSRSPIGCVIFIGSGNRSITSQRSEHTKSDGRIGAKAPHLTRHFSCGILST